MTIRAAGNSPIIQSLPSKRANSPSARDQTVVAVAGATNRQPPSVHAAIAPDSPAPAPAKTQAPLGAGPTIQHWPGIGETGGSSIPTASTTGSSSASIRASASLWKTSFCA